MDSSLGWSTIIANRETIAPHSLTFDRLQILLGTAPGVGKSWSFEILKNGSTTGLICVISDAATSAIDATNSVGFSAGDTITLRSVPTGTPAGSGSIRWNIRQSATGMTAIFGGAQQNLNSGAIRFNEIMNYTGWVIDENLVKSMIPTGGTISNLHIITSVAPGGATSYTIDISKNATPQSVSATISGASVSANDTSNSFSVAAGDFIALRSSPSGTPTTAFLKWSCSFSPTNDGESFLTGSYGSSVAQSGSVYGWLKARGNWHTTESNRQVLGADFTVKALYANVNPAPGSGRSRTFSFRVNSSTSSAVAPISGTNASANITGQSVAVADGDLINLLHVGAGSPAVTNYVNTGVLLYAASASQASDTLTDDFNDNSLDTALWNATGTVNETSGQSQIPSGTSITYAELQSDIQYTLAGSYASSQLVDAGNQSLASWEVYPVILTIDASNQLFWYVNQGTLYAESRVAGSNTTQYSVAYNSSTHAYLRIREASGTTYWDTSTDGINWTNRASATNPIAVTGLYQGWVAQNYSAEATTTTAKIDNFNITPPAANTSAMLLMF